MAEFFANAKEDDVAAVAKAFATYALVPYLGILFCPGAVIVGCIGIIRSHPSSGSTRRGICYRSIVAGLTIAAVQLVLWWILYRMPDWARR
jgi:hypothetical protein